MKLKREKNIVKLRRKISHVLLLISKMSKLELFYILRFIIIEYLCVSFRVGSDYISHAQNNL